MMTIDMTGKNKEAMLEKVIDGLYAMILEFKMKYDAEVQHWKRFEHYCRFGKFPD